jgi:hypothetical protein
MNALAKVTSPVASVSRAVASLNHLAAGTPRHCGHTLPSPTWSVVRRRFLNGTACALLMRDHSRSHLSQSGQWGQITPVSTAGLGRVLRGPGCVAMRRVGRVAPHLILRVLRVSSACARMNRPIIQPKKRGVKNVPRKSVKQSSKPMIFRDI